MWKRAAGERKNVGSRLVSFPRSAFPWPFLFHSQRRKPGTKKKISLRPRFLDSCEIKKTKEKKKEKNSPLRFPSFSCHRLTSNHRLETRKNENGLSFFFTFLFLHFLFTIIRFTLWKKSASGKSNNEKKAKRKRKRKRKEKDISLTARPTFQIHKLLMECSWASVDVFSFAFLF